MIKCWHIISIGELPLLSICPPHERSHCCSLGMVRSHQDVWLKERTLQDRRSHCKMLSDRTSKTIMRSHYGRAEIAGIGWVSGSVTHAVSEGCCSLGFVASTQPTASFELNHSSKMRERSPFQEACPLNLKPLDLEPQRFLQRAALTPFHPYR
ncbi:hypothetical protein [Nostoc sp.]